jgi:tetratricopeptide (TPR) repeat protein
MNHCPTDEYLETFLAESLSPRECERLEDHFAVCVRCQQRLHELTNEELPEHWHQLLTRSPDDKGVVEPAWIRHLASLCLRRVTENSAVPSAYPLPLPSREEGRLRGAIAEADAESAPTVWPVVPGYEVLGELGRGGMGIIYKARQLGLNRLVALKMILAGAHAGAEAIARFRREAEAAARLQHRNIVQIYEVGEHDGRPFFSLEYVDGGDLADRLDGTPLPVRQAVELTETLAHTIEYAHQQGIVHRDLTPSNVLLTADGTPKVTDFGLARFLIGGGASPTRTGSILGTPSYMAPEQAQANKQAVGPATDVYALGAILYEMLTGRPPFKAETPLDTALQVVHQEPVAPSRLHAKVPHDLETICLKCLEKEPCRRYASAAALAADLKRFRNREPIQARRVRSWERAAKWIRRRPAAAALAGVLMAVALTLPIAGLHYAAELEQRQQTERTRLNDKRVDVQSLHARAQQAIQSADWKQAKRWLEEAWEKIQAEPALADLRERLSADRVRVKARLNALNTLQAFRGDRDGALFHATLATGEDFATNRTIAQQKAAAALQCAGLSADGHWTAIHLPALTDEEKTEMRTGSYALLLMLAEMETRRLPQATARKHAPALRSQGHPGNAGQESGAGLTLIPTWPAPQPLTGEHEQILRQALSLLDCADSLGVRTRALHLRRARYWKLLGEERHAVEEQEVVQTLAANETTALDHFLVGQEYYSQGALVPAMREFHRALGIDARHFWARYFLSICCVLSGKPEEADAHLSFCQGERPELIWIYLLRGYARGQMKEYEAAENDFGRALTLGPTPAARYVLYNNRGVMRVLQEGARAQGVQDLKQAAALCPDKHDAWASLAEADLLDDRLDDARTHLDQAIAVAGRQLQAGDLKPENLALLHYRRARLYLRHSDQEAAMGKLAEVLPLIRDPSLLPLLAALPFRRGDREAAVRDLAEAARLAENDDALRARAEADRGRLLHLQQRFEEALAAYAAALKANPRRVDVLRARGEVLLVLGRYAEAATAFDTYLNRGGRKSAAVYRQRGLAFARLGRHQEAILDYSGALRANPKDEDKPLLYRSRGQEYLAVQALQPALDDFQAALRLDPKNADAYLGRAHARVSWGDLANGVADAEEAVQRKPKEPHLWYGAARVYAQAAAKLPAEPVQAMIRSRYQSRAETLLRSALLLVPANERSAWREKLLKDKSLYPIRSRLVDLVAQFGAPKPRRE